MKVYIPAIRTSIVVSSISGFGDNVESGNLYVVKAKDCKMFIGASSPYEAFQIGLGAVEGEIAIPAKVHEVVSVNGVLMSREAVAWAEHPEGDPCRQHFSSVSEEEEFDTGSDYEENDGDGLEFV